MFFYDLSRNRFHINHSTDVKCFTSQAFTEGETVGYYYGTLVYDYTYIRGSRQFGEASWQLTPFFLSSFLQYTIHHKMKMSRWNLRENTVWIVFAKLSV